MAFYDDVVSADSPYVWLKLNETSGTTANDAQGRANFARSGSNGSVNQTALIKTGVSISITGASTYYSSSDTDVTTVFDDNNTNTIEMWFSLSSLSSAIDLIRQGGDSTGYGIQVATNGTISGWFNTTNVGFFSGLASASGAVATGNTYHVVITWDGTTQRLYLNGSEVDNVTAAAGTFTASSAAVDFPGRFTTGSGTRKFDEVAFYRSTLSADRVLAHYNAGRGFWTESPPATNTAVSGKDATVTVTSGVTVNADLTNIAVAGQAATVTAQTHATINVNQTNVFVEGKSATVTADTPNATVNADSTNIAVAGLAAAVAAGGSVIVSATTSSVTLDAKDATVAKFSGAELLPATARTFETGLTLWNRNTTNTSAITRVSGVSNTGSWSMRLTVAALNSEAAAYSDPIPVDPDDTYWFEGFVFPEASGDKSVHIDFYDAADVQTSTHASTMDPLNVGNGSFYYLLWVSAQPDPTATYARLRVRGQATAGNHIYVDDLSFRTSATVGVTIQPSQATNLTTRGLAANITVNSSSIQTTTAATITVDALDAEVATMPDATHVTIGTDTTNVGVDAKEGWPALPTQTTYTEPFSDTTYESWISQLHNQQGYTMTGRWAGSDYSTSTTTKTVLYADVLVPSNFTSTVTMTADVGMSTPTVLYNTYSYLATGNALVELIALNTNTVLSSTTLYSAGSYQLTRSLVAGDWVRIQLTVNKTGQTPSSPSAPSTTAPLVGWIDQITLAGLANPVISYVEVTPTPANVAVAGNDVILNTQVNAPVTNILVGMQQPNVVTPGQTSLGASKTNIGVAGYAPTISGERSREIYTTAARITLGLIDHDIRTREDTFKFIPADDSALTALDADELLSVNLGGLLHNQNKFWAFKLGNVGNEKINLTVSIVSDNEDLDDLVQLSTDKSTYSSTIEIESIPPNGISDPIWFRLNSGSARPGAGTFLINVEQSNA